MSDSLVTGAVDAAYLEDLLQRWQQAPDALPESWRHFFEGYALALSGTAGGAAHAQSNVASLIYAHRSQGHLMAHLDPLADPPALHPALELELFGLNAADLERTFDAGHLGGQVETAWSAGLDLHGRPSGIAAQPLPLREILATLRETYCRTIGVEYMHVQDRGVRRWLQAQMEVTRNTTARDTVARRALLEALTDAELFEHFVHSRYPGQKRFSLEGGEALIAALRQVIEAAGSLDVDEIVIGMAHRGRLNVLANILGMPYESVFVEFEGAVLPDWVHGDGDVKYHRGYSAEYDTRAGKVVHLSLTANPSHLEVVGPVVQGRVRAKQRQRGDTVSRKKVLPLLIHGDAAFAGQGLVAETLNLSQLPGYRTGGTLHLIVNNQIGFTTSPDEARSSAHATDVAKMIEAPIFHVNGDDPEAVVHCAELALRFRQQFGRDVVVDMICYRRHGHNEGDDPALTQPELYAKIKERPSVRRLYTEQLVHQRVIDSAEAEAIAARFRGELSDAHARARHGGTIQVQAFEDRWRGMDAPFSHVAVHTAVPQTTLERVARALCTVPEDFALNPKVARRLPALQAAITSSSGTFDWAFAELLAIGTLLDEGVPVRLSGQDSARGTFSQRHAVWQQTRPTSAASALTSYTPLNHIREGQARFCVYNSALSEAAVLGFEYGYAATDPAMLVLWEAQFGDFVNGAQVIVDQFIAGSESKWQRDSGLVLLLPHGFEGQGPEHSNAYLERFLAACAENNLQVCNPTTPAQYFHLLRRQMKRTYRMPLVVMAPKSMLRNPRAVSSVDELLEPRSFEELLDDPAPPPGAQRVVLCSGKVYWDLLECRERETHPAVLLRLEQLYPLHEGKLQALLERHPVAASEVVWAQEEPQNRGGWAHFLGHIAPRLSPTVRVRYVGRAASASPATGSLSVHQIEQQALQRLALAPDAASQAEGVVVRDIVIGRGARS